MEWNKNEEEEEEGKEEERLYHHFMPLLRQGDPQQKYTNCSHNSNKTVLQQKFCILLHCDAKEGQKHGIRIINSHINLGDFYIIPV